MLQIVSCVGWHLEEMTQSATMEEEKRQQLSDPMEKHCNYHNVEQTTRGQYKYLEPLGLRDGDHFITM